MIFNQLFFSIFIQNKFGVFWHSYVHKCKQGEHHTFVYTSERIDITQHSWAQRDLWTTSCLKLKQRSSLRSASTHTLRRRWTWASLTSLIFTEKDKDLSMNPKASLPSWQIGVCLKSPFVFLKTPCTRTKTIKVKRTKQNKHLISHKDLWILQGFKFSYKIFNHAAITRQTN